MPKCNVCKKDKCNCKPIQKVYYNIVIETLLPATITYKVLAETPEQAVDLIKNIPPTTVKYKLHGRREFKLTVYEYGRCIIKYMKNLAGRIQ